MAWQAYHTHIVRHILAAELCAETYFVCLLQQCLLQFGIAEGTPCLIARGGQAVVVVGGCQFDGQQVLLRTGAANDDSDMIWWASGCTETLHLLDEERNQRTGVLDTCFGLLIEVGLVCAAASFGYAEEMVFHTLGSLDVYLCGQVALGVHFLVHRQRCILRIAQVVLRVGIIHTVTQCLFVAVARPYLLPFLAVYDSRTRVLTERQLPLASHLGIAQEGESHIFVVRTGFGVAQYLGYLLVVAAAEHKTHVVESLLRHLGEAFGFHF